MPFCNVIKQILYISRPALITDIQLPQHSEQRQDTMQEGQDSYVTEYQSIKQVFHCGLTVNWNVTRHSLVETYQRFRESVSSIFTIYESSLKMETEISFETLCVSHSSSIQEINTARYLEMLVPIYQISRCHIPEDDNIDSHHPENLESHRFLFSYSNCRREKQMKEIPDGQ
jgi:hypothetical protein